MQKIVTSSKTQAAGVLYNGRNAAIPATFPVLHATNPIA